MKNVALILSLFLIVSCNTKNTILKTANPNTSRIWMLTSFKNYKKNQLVEKNAFLDLTNTERAVAKMGCNTISFNYSIKNSKLILFSQGIKTEMACNDMQLEEDFCKFIVQEFSYKIVSHQLILTNSKGEEIQFVAQDWD